MPDPLTLPFWSDEERRLWDEIAPTLISILFAGGKSGHDTLPSGVRLLLNWDVFNQDAVTYLNQYRLGTWMNISDVTRRNAVRIIEDWIKSGERIEILSSRLEPWFGELRAKRVAVTEVTRIYAEGNQMAWKATGLVGGNRWNTARDEKVCPICAPLDGIVIGLGENGFTTVSGGLGIAAPPAHASCRCWLTPIVSEQGLRQGIRSVLR